MALLELIPSDTAKEEVSSGSTNKKVAGKKAPAKSSEPKKTSTKAKSAEPKKSKAASPAKKTAKKADK
jgi:hypothetical protein